MCAIIDDNDVLKLGLARISMPRYRLNYGKSDNALKIDTSNGESLHTQNIIQEFRFNLVISPLKSDCAIVMNEDNHISV